MKPQRTPRLALFIATVATVVLSACHNNPPPPEYPPLFAYKPECPPPPPLPPPPPPPPPKEELTCPDAGVASHESHEWFCVDELGKRDGPYREFFPTEVKAKRDGQYDHGEKTGTWTSFHPNGVPEAKGAFLHDHATGRWTYFSDSGTKASTADFREGKYEGLVCDWSEAGANTSEVSYHGDRKHGLAVQWDDKGAVVGLARFENGKEVKMKPFEQLSNSMNRIHYCELEPCAEGSDLVGEVAGGGVGCQPKDSTTKNGHWTYFDDKGRKIYEGDYRNDEKVGEWRRYDESGSITKTETYER